jgi:ABC-type transport system involved in Fe-S cluster assembly fused permease/ATPase subunit
MSLDKSTPHHTHIRLLLRKSTLIRLMYRFYDPAQGTILIDNKHMNDLTIDSIRSIMAVVPQV